MENQLQLKIIQSNKVDISLYKWKIFDPLIVENNQEIILNEISNKVSSSTILSSTSFKDLNSSSLND